MGFYSAPIFQDGDDLKVTLPPKFIQELATILKRPVEAGLVLELAPARQTLEILWADHIEEPNDGLRTTLQRLGSQPTLKLPRDMHTEYRFQAGQALKFQTLVKEGKALIKPKHPLPDNRMKPY
jgi:hypothetical protein